MLGVKYTHTLVIFIYEKLIAEHVICGDSFVSNTSNYQGINLAPCPVIIKYTV